MLCVTDPLTITSPLTTPPVEKFPAMTLTLQEVLIIGNNNDQVKFSVFFKHLKGNLRKMLHIKISVSSAIHGRYYSFL